MANGTVEMGQSGGYRVLRMPEILNPMSGNSENGHSRPTPTPNEDITKENGSNENENPLTPGIEEPLPPG